MFVFVTHTIKQIQRERERDKEEKDRRKKKEEELEPIQEIQSLKAPAAAATTATVGNGNGGQIRYRSPSAAELLEGQSDLQQSLSGENNNKMTMMTMKQHHHQQQQQQHLQQQRGGGKHETLLDKIYRFRGVIIVISVPLLLISFVLYLMPPPPSSDVNNYYYIGGDGGGRDDNDFTHRKVSPKSTTKSSYAVIFDAGSSGSRVHVFHFDHRLDLVPIGKDLELFVQKKPGLSFYAKDPRAAADSLLSLLEQAENVVPKELRSSTPVRIGATAGLRALEGDTSDRILQEVRDFLKRQSSLKSQPDWVTILDGSQEGSYQWVTINYLLGNLGKKYSETVGVVDLGGGSVQMAYAISETDAAKAPRILNGEDTYVKEMYLKGATYYLYVHSYLHYGLLAARAEILNAVDDTANPCILAGFHGSYRYGGKIYGASASPSGSNMNSCRRLAFKALKINESTCTHMKCTFGGIWNGGGGDGQKNLFVASFFFDRAAEAGFVDRNMPIAKVRPMDFEDAAKRACETRLEDAKPIYPNVDEDNLPYLCMDLVYQYTLLVDGFGLDPWQEITLVKQVQYRHALIEAAWPLGSAIEAVSSPT